MGWKEPVLNPLVKIIDSSDSDFDISVFLKEYCSSEHIHIFSGIAAYRTVTLAFKAAIKRKCRIGILTEPLDFRGFKGLLRNIRGHYHYFKYSTKIEFLLPIGRQARLQFENWGYEKTRIYDWAYCVEQSRSMDERLVGNKVNDTFKIMFAGSLIKRKGYDVLIEALQKLQSKNYIADFFCYHDGDATYVDKLKQQLKLSSKIRLRPFLTNNELRRKMVEYDLFILPSRHDGWGAVVSESLMEGTPVLVSKFCGASILIGNDNVGKVLCNLTADATAEDLAAWMGRGKLNYKQRLENRNWAKTTISSEALAIYFSSILAHLSKRQNVNYPIAPWIKSEIEEEEVLLPVYY